MINPLSSTSITTSIQEITSSTPPLTVVPPTGSQINGTVIYICTHILATFVKAIPTVDTMSYSAYFDGLQIL